ncbi:MAG: glycoside hydrolase family 32 protein [Verrucomicrobia bacterium]|nr:glycoside hydrolase family 32 protein [Verrucomicrobiota bacterium]
MKIKTTALWIGLAILTVCRADAAEEAKPDLTSGNPEAKYRSVIRSQDKAVFGDAALGLRRWMEVRDLQRPIYHTMGPMGFTFDVNGPIYHDGRYHLFYHKSSFVFKPDKEDAEILDVSPHFYAPNPHMIDNKGPGGSQRRLMFGWVRGGQTPTKDVPYWDGNHSLPRVLTLVSNKLIQEPIPELQVLRHGHMQLTNRLIESSTPGLLKDFTGNALEVIASFDPQGATAKRFGVKLRMSKDGNEQTVVYYEPASGRFGVSGSVVDGEISDHADFPAGRRVTLHIFLDRSVVEVFAAGRVITKRTYSDPTSQGLDVFSDGGSVKLDVLDIWRMKSIWDQGSNGKS